MAWNGNTPTSVGKTVRRCAASQGRGKHPHERGEDEGRIPISMRNSETPPRAWGRRLVAGRGCGKVGNTPTSVGKTPAAFNVYNALGKHPHERGEDAVGIIAFGHTAETPPRAWGRPEEAEMKVSSGGNTPTSVGKTYSTTSTAQLSWKHPHERGEDHWTGMQKEPPIETPPRAWGRLLAIRARHITHRNTPTSVGKTPRPW